MNGTRYQAALNFAVEKHDGQFRIGGAPYVEHVIAVAEILRGDGYDEDYQIAGLFHDLLEDTDATEEEILKLGGERVLQTVKLLTKTPNYVIEDYVCAIKEHEMAKAIKSADRLHNLLSATIASEHFKRKYILESIAWYYDFDPRIQDAVKRLNATLKNPIKSQVMGNAIEIKGENLKNQNLVLFGDICYCVTPTQLKTVKNGYLVCEKGKVLGVFKKLPKKYVKLPLHSFKNRLIIPGLVDLHIHAPQYAFRGMGMDLQLMDWLKEQTFPEESKYGDEAYARKAYKIFANAMRVSATTHANIFATKHFKSTKILMDLMEKTGIVSFVGKVNMDRESPDELCELSADHSASDTFYWIDGSLGKYKRTFPILTPRFIPCCTPRLLEQLREIQIAYDLPVQSHLSENQGEVDFVRMLCPTSDFYGDAYDDYGLFGEDRRFKRPIKTVMAHCVYSTEAEMQRIKENGVFVAHCPASNMNLSSGIAPIRKYLSMGLNMGLGSDVAGGHSESMLRAVCDAVQVSKLYWRLVDESSSPLTFKEAFYLATKGGGEFFGKVGSFEKGYDFNAVVLDDSRVRYPQKLSLDKRLEGAAYASCDAFGVIAKFVNGKMVYLRDSD